MVPAPAPALVPASVFASVSALTLDRDDEGMTKLSVAPTDLNPIPFSLSLQARSESQWSILATALKFISSRIDFRSWQLGSGGLNEIVLQVWVALCSLSWATVYVIKSINKQKEG